MRERIRRICAVANHEAWRHFSGQRMWVIAPLVILFIALGAWGFSDPAFDDGLFNVETATDAMFLTSIVIVVLSPLSVVLIGFDAISKRRITGELAIDLSQPMPRSDYAISQLLGVWGAANGPTQLGLWAGIALIYTRMGMFPPLGDILVMWVATMLLLLWYSSLQLLASSYARDLGASVTWGIGTWLVFGPFLWIIPTMVLATMLGVDVTDTLSVSYDRLQERVDLFSPNGVFQLMLETRHSPDQQPLLNGAWIWLAGLCWAVLPSALFVRRIQRMTA
jgi:ABC-type transport system involved in multi-copper enzyme maturation permease subunit